MNEDELTQKDVNVKILSAEKALLRGYKIALTRLSSKRCGGMLDIIPSEGNIIEGVLYEIPDKDRIKIEKKEGVSGGAYKEIPKPLKVKTAEGTLINGVTSYEVCEKENPPPASKEYKNSVLRGACEHGLSEKYRIKLKAVLEKREI